MEYARAMYRQKYPLIAQTMDIVKQHFPNAKLIKVTNLKTNKPVKFDLH